MSNLTRSEVQLQPSISNSLTQSPPVTSQLLPPLSETRAVSPPSGRPALHHPSSSLNGARAWTSSVPSLSSPTSPSSSPSFSSSLPPLAVQPVPLVVGGLTETLLQDYEERRVQLKLEENSVGPELGGPAGTGSVM